MVTKEKAEEMGGYVARMGQLRPSNMLAGETEENAT
jgi:hypothetical protein